MTFRVEFELYNTLTLRTRKRVKTVEAFSIQDAYEKATNRYLAPCYTIMNVYTWRLLDHKKGMVKKSTHP